MSLDWSTERLDEEARAKHFPPDDAGRMSDALHTLIWATIPVGVGEITAKNADDFWHRLDLWQKGIGAQFQVRNNIRSPWVPLLVTKEQVHAAIGLHTNAASKTKSRFLKDLYDTHARFQ